jgi:hypothetical protein
MRPRTAPHRAKARSVSPAPMVCVAPHTTLAQRGANHAIPERGLRWLALPRAQVAPYARQEAGAIVAPRRRLKQPAPFAHRAGSQAALAATSAPWRTARVLPINTARQAPPPAKLQRALNVLAAHFQPLVPRLAQERPATPAATECMEHRRATFARAAHGARRSVPFGAAMTFALGDRLAHWARQVAQLQHAQPASLARIPQTLVVAHAQARPAAQVVLEDVAPPMPSKPHVRSAMLASLQLRAPPRARHARQDRRQQRARRAAQAAFVLPERMVQPALRTRCASSAPLERGPTLLGQRRAWVHRARGEDQVRLAPQTPEMPRVLYARQGRTLPLLASAPARDPPAAPAPLVLQAQFLFRQQLVHPVLLASFQTLQLPPLVLWPFMARLALLAAQLAPLAPLEEQVQARPHARHARQALGPITLALRAAAAYLALWASSDLLAPQTLSQTHAASADRARLPTQRVLAPAWAHHAHLAALARLALLATALPRVVFAVEATMHQALVRAAAPALVHTTWAARMARGALLVPLLQLQHSASFARQEPTRMFSEPRHASALSAPLAHSGPQEE